MRKDSYTPTTLTASVIIRVRFNETDPLGIVWHGNYIKYFEEGREAFGRKYGLSYLDVQRFLAAKYNVKATLPLS